jgi:hypothetical protein
MMHHIEKDGVFNREQTTKPRIADIVDRKLGLQTDDVAKLAQKTLSCVAQLPRGRDVLGVEHRDVFAAHQTKSDVQGARFGAWPTGRRDNDFIGRPQVQGVERKARRMVVLFNDELDVEFAARIVE